ncbi:MAG: hypothetical protein HDR12_06340 [Lachnospiraceae bacterium]|nr:hypothetical protein [Lachnospiraceae bacterium]
MESVDITEFMHLDISTAIPDLFNIFGYALIGGITMAIMFHMASTVVFGLIEFLDIKDK